MELLSKECYYLRFMYIAKVFFNQHCMREASDGQSFGGYNLMHPLIIKEFELFLHVYQLFYFFNPLPFIFACLLPSNL